MAQDEQVCPIGSEGVNNWFLPVKGEKYRETTCDLGCNQQSSLYYPKPKPVIGGIMTKAVGINIFSRERTFSYCNPCTA
jgi:hypothetical protein